jgi:dipeptidyl aminopeptidase/acylaminoacyl peptidase
MFAVMGLGIGPEQLGMTKPMPPARLEVKATNIGGSGLAPLGRQVALTPDGAAMVYVMETESGDNVLAYQLLGSDMPVLIQGSQSIVSPQISSNGRYIIGETEAEGRRRRVRIPLKGGEQSAVEEKPDERLLSLESDGVRAPQLIDRDRSALGVRAAPGKQSGRAVLRNLKTGSETQAIGGDVVEARYAAKYIFFVRPDGSLWAAPFDVKTGKMTVTPVQIGSGVATSESGVAQFAVSKNGSVAYLPEAPGSLVLVGRDGKLNYATSSRRAFSNPRFSPDGKSIATDFTDQKGRDVWAVSVTGGALTRLTNQGDAHDATWRPDGRFISFTSYRRGALGIYRARPETPNAPLDSIFTAEPLVYSGEWLKDGTGIVTTAANLDKN